jgi:uncharacterized protein
MIIEQIKKENLQALKEKNTMARGVYSVIINKYNLAAIEKKVAGEQMQDADTIKIIQKTIKELADEAENYKKAKNAENEQRILNQKKLLEGYLPKMLTETEIKAIIEKLADKSIGAVMKHFKENYLGKCDMGLVGSVVREL